MKSILSLLLLFAAFTPFNSVNAADETYTFVVKKQEDKKKTRWSLDEWLKTRDNMRLQDIWLSMHSPSPYEFYLGGDLQMTTGLQNHRGYFAAYAAIFGLGAEWESVYKRVNGLFYLRLMGHHYQGTNLTLHGGYRMQTTPDAIRGPFAGLGLTIYFIKFFGIEGVYRHYFPNSESTGLETYVSNYFEAGPFIDFSFIRVYGGMLKEVGGFQDRSAFNAGVKLFF
jgi:hypothetical protein